LFDVAFLGVGEVANAGCGGDVADRAGVAVDAETGGEEERVVGRGDADTEGAAFVACGGAAVDWGDAAGVAGVAKREGTITGEAAGLGWRDGADAAVEAGIVVTWGGRWAFAADAGVWVCGEWGSGGGAVACVGTVGAVDAGAVVETWAEVTGWGVLAVESPVWAGEFG